ncbi:MAG TPA: hypothetical protein VNO25_06040 [Streptosporangiaceae bacterium]|nr:hypothetical protein [Streptosporangiaceae bacterium]
MSDILNFGRDREPRWRSRWWLVVAAAGIAVALTAAFLWPRPGLRQHGAQSRPSAAGSSPAALGELGSPVAAPSPLPSEPARMTGQPLPRDASLSLLLGGQEPAWLSVATGRTEPIRGLPPVASYQLTAIAGGWAAQPFPAGDAGCDTCAPGPLPVYYVADGARAASRIGAADYTAPAATPGALWLVSYRRGADMSTAAGDAQEISVTGAKLGPRIRLPAGYVIDRGTRAGLLLVQEQQQGSSPLRYELWDPGTRRVTRSFVNLIAASPAEIAWMPDCAGSCRVHVLDLSGGRVQEISLPGRSKSYQGAFSPDGQLLALLVTATVTADGRPAMTRLMVATVASGRISAVPGTTVGSGIGIGFGWQAGSRRLIADVGVGATEQPEGQPEGQIAVWQPGDARLSTALARAPNGSWPVIDEGLY